MTVAQLRRRLADVPQDWTINARDNDDLLCFVSPDGGSFGVMAGHPDLPIQYADVQQYVTDTTRTWSEAV